MENLPINITDIVVIVVMLLSALVALALGFTRTILYFAAWGVALYAAFRFYPMATPYAQQYLSGQLGEFAAGFVIFLGVLLVAWLIAHLLTRGIRRSFFNPIDRALGFVLGAAIGVAIVSMGYIVTEFLYEQEQPEWLQEAKSLPYIQAAAERIKAVLPEDFVARIEATQDELEGAAAEQGLSVLTGGQQPGTAGGEAPSGLDNMGYSESERLDLERAIEGSGEGPPPAEATEPTGTEPGETNP